MLVRGENKAATFANKSPEDCGLENGRKEGGKRQPPRETWEGGDTCRLTADSHCCTTETNTAL